MQIVDGRLQLILGTGHHLDRGADGECLVVLRIFLQDLGKKIGGLLPPVLQDKRFNNTLLEHVLVFIVLLCAFLVLLHRQIEIFNAQEEVAH